MTVKKVLLLSVIGFFVAVAVFGSIFYFAVFKKPDATVKEIKTYNYVVGELFANIRESRKILKVNLVLETTDEKLSEKLDANRPKITNNILELLRSKDEGSLSVEQGQKILRSEILESVKKIVSSDKVIDVYFVEFIIQ